MKSRKRTGSEVLAIDIPFGDMQRNFELIFLGEAGVWRGSRGDWGLHVLGDVEDGGPVEGCFPGG